VEDDERSGRPRSHRTDENVGKVEKVWNLVHLGRCLSVRSVAVHLNLDKQWQRPELLPNDWILHHDNAPAHRVLSVKQFLV
jgi:hypothetical protein